jgi:hypothetical protein
MTTPIEKPASKPADEFVTILTVRLEHSTPLKELDLLEEDTVHFVDGIGRLTVLHAHYYVRGDGDELVDLIR